MSRLIAATFAVVLLGSALPALADVDNFSHNGSRMRFEWSTDHARILYVEPRAGLASAGVDRGSLLFEGSISKDGLRGMGVRFAIDDFGTGYSSLSYLRDLPIEKLKIDRSFIRGLPEDAKSFAITSAIVSLAQTLGLEVLAEGVETEAQADVLRNLG